MRDAHRCSGTGFEDFEGSVIVRWKVLLSPKCRKKTFKCHRKQVRRARAFFPHPFFCMLLVEVWHYISSVWSPWCFITGIFFPERRWADWGSCCAPIWQFERCGGRARPQRRIAPPLVFFTFTKHICNSSMLSAKGSRPIAMCLLARGILPQKAPFLPPSWIS